MTETVEIQRLGARGDGIAADGTLVPYALPGETVAIRREEGRRAELESVERPAPERVEPFCPYYGRCGGCRTQHLAREAELAWKRGIVAAALSQAGLPIEPEPALDAHGAGRRRITLHVRQIEGRAEAGLMEARSHALVPLDHCPITVPALHRAPAVARALAAPVGGGRKPLDVAVTATDQGLDVDLRGHGPVNDRASAALVRLAGELGLARLSLHGERLMEAEPVSVASAGGMLFPSPGGFLQATEAGQDTLAGLVVAALGPRTRKVADLFSGCGPLALAMAGRAAVHAVESEAAALAGLDRSARSATGLKQITTERRDLFRRPLLPLELNAFDAVVFDPPRAGAEAQARQLAASKVPLVVGVACDAGTFSRDAAILVGGGYRLERVTPVDQFRHAGHVEMVGLFRPGSPEALTAFRFATRSDDGRSPGDGETTMADTLLHRPSLRTGLLLAVLCLSTAASAQSRLAPDQTGTGGGPASTITAPNTNRLGVTKPPGDSLGPGEVPAPRVERREREQADRIERSICNGCN